jgi:Meiotic cell cortex C-terminal pleckstrin homology
VLGTYTLHSILTTVILLAVFIEGVRQIIDPNSYPPGLHQNSLIVQTPDREIKITASTRERHVMWFNVGLFGLARVKPATNVDETSLPGHKLLVDTASDRLGRCWTGRPSSTAATQ